MMFGELRTALKDMCEIWGDLSKAIKPLANEEKYKKALNVLEESEFKYGEGPCPNCGDWENVEDNEVGFIDDNFCIPCKCHKCGTEFNLILEVTSIKIVK